MNITNKLLIAKKDQLSQSNAAEKNLIQKPIFILGFCFLLSVIYLLICTKSSPLYPFNDWVDANAFFTMGKGMMNGKIPYRDLFEQKGALLYLIHGIAYLISNTSFLGVYIFEVISFSIFLFYSYKLISLFIDLQYTLIALPLITTCILNLKSFSIGDSAEEFCLPMVAISLFYLIDYFKNVYPNQLPNRSIFLNGILAGCVLWIKLSLLGLWFGWIVSIFFCLMINKHYRSGIKCCLIFLLGMLIVTIPWIIYFGINNSISEWINTYFTINLTAYANNISLFAGIKNIFTQIRSQTYQNPLFCGLLLLGITVFITTKKFIKNLLHRICLLFCGLCLAFGVYGGGRDYIYYFLIFSPFIVFGFIVLLNLYFEEFGKVKANKITIMILFVSMVTTVLFSLHFNQNTYMLSTKKEELVQYKFASIINQSKNPTLLNYGLLDMGFYTTTGIIPNIKFFEIQNLDYSKFPINIDEQNRYIKEKVVEYVVTRLPVSVSMDRLKEYPYLLDNYQLIDREKQVNQNNEFNYFLFRRIK